MSALGYSRGINTGEMLTTALANPTEPWGVFDADESYRWETGNNEWNQMVTVSDVNGVVVSFDRPIQINYTHNLLNDANIDGTYVGKKFFLEYQGVGQLYGFPWVENTDSALELPTINNIVDLNITLSGKPVVTAAPAVIEGELQE